MSDYVFTGFIASGRRLPPVILQGSCLENVGHLLSIFKDDGLEFAEIRRISRCGTVQVRQALRELQRPGGATRGGRGYMAGPRLVDILGEEYRRHHYSKVWKRRIDHWYVLWRRLDESSRRVLLSEALRTGNLKDLELELEHQVRRSLQ